MAEASLADPRGEGKASSPKDLDVDDVVTAYRSIVGHAALVSGTISHRPDGAVPSVCNIRTQWSQRDIDRKEKTSFTKTFSVQLAQEPEEKCSYVGCSVPQELSHLLWDVESPSGKKRAVFLKKKGKKGEEKQFIEIWNVKQKEKTIDVKALDKHGDIVGNDGQFGSVQWSKCETYLLYIAEKKKPKTASFFETASSSDDKDKGDNAEVPIKGGEYLHQESWGEQLVERHHTVICRLTISSNVVTLLAQVPSSYSPGQVLWGPDNHVVFVAWCHDPFRLGLRFCVERRSCVFKASFDGGECEMLSERDRAVRCPSFSPDLSRLVYLETAEGGPHNQCSRLMMINWKKWMESKNKEGAREIVVDIVNSPYKNGYNPGQEEFPGLYTWADQGAQRNWLSDNVHVLFTSYWRSRSAVVLVNTDTKAVCSLFPFDSYPFREPHLPPAKQLPVVMDKQSGQSVAGGRSPGDGCAWSCSLLDVRGMDVLLSCSWPNMPSFPVLGRLNPSPTKRSQWVWLGDGENEQVVLGQYGWTLRVLDPREFPAAHKDYDYLDFEAILYLPVTEEKDKTKPPLVVFPHGGPHSSFDCSFTLNPAVFASCGFAVLCVNYRASLGFGQDSINSLLGNIGNLDVKDCMLAMRKVQEADLVDPKNTFVYGGSHGGFLSAHLIGQYPDQFRAASMRNPVTNLTSLTWFEGIDMAAFRSTARMGLLQPEFGPVTNPTTEVGTSDIRDWVFVEAGQKFDYDSLAKEDLLAKLWSASPVSYVDKVKTPVMLHIGLKDLRVPPSQGLEYYKMLKARNVPVQCHTYPESNHSLSEVEVEADSLVHSILWFSKHLAD